MNNHIDKLMERNIWNQLIWHNIHWKLIHTHSPSHMQDMFVSWKQMVVKKC